MLSVVEAVGLSDVGRQRESNEDNWVIAEPLFAVADGMGGAQAGEVASETAAAVFDRPAGEGGEPESLLASLIRDANRQIFEMAQTDSAMRGMGTTLTAAMVWSQGVSIGHVGDSRAYRLRGGELEQLTHDHSLVAELQRSGQLTAEAAESHPQRSIITRALGPESEVEVDTHTHTARDGDVYLLCSDGLTGMVSDAALGSILRGAVSLREAAEELIRAANQGGGKDNITVVLFRLGETGDGAAAEQDTLSGQETIAAGLSVADVEAAAAERDGSGDPEARSRAATPSGARGRAATAARTAPRAGAAAPRPRTADDGAPTREEAPRPRRASATGRRPKRSVRYRVGRVFVVLVVVGAIGAGAVFGARTVYFLGTDDSGLVTVYRGLPYQLPFGLDLYSAHYTSGVPAQSLSRTRRERLLDHKLRQQDDASDLVRQLERGTLAR